VPLSLCHLLNFSFNCSIVNICLTSAFFLFRTSTTRHPISQGRLLGDRRAMNGNRHSLERVSPAELYNVITAASSQDPSRVQAATTRLKEMLLLGGTYDALQDIAAQKPLSLAIRQQSIIQFKNVVTSHWKSRKSAPLSHYLHFPLLITPHQITLR
jgi:hypothetical protein